MKTKNEMKDELARLVARKVELTRERVSIKRIPYKDRSPEQHAELLRLWSECSVQKEQIRYTSLAYAFVRGRRYWHVERHVHEQHAPWAKGIANYAEADVEAVKSWLAAPVSNEEAAEFAASVEAARIKARSARDARRKAKAA